MNINNTATTRYPMTAKEAAVAHRAMTDAIRIIAMYANRERAAGNEAQADALTRHLARLAQAQRPVCDYVIGFNPFTAPHTAAGVDALAG
jgi:hypothetical protein